MKQPYLEKKFEGDIWRMEIDEQNDNILLEIRDAANKQVSFASVSLVTGEVNFENLITDERWLAGLEAGSDGVMLVHNYASAGGPGHKGIIAFDAKTGARLWENYNFAFHHLSNNGPIIYDTRLQPVKLMLADIHSGELKRPYELTIDTELVNRILIPETLPVSAFENQALPTEPYQNTLQCLDINDFRIVSLHTFFDFRLNQELYIIEDGEVIYHDLLHTNIQKMQPESFVIHAGRLIYIKNRSELVVLKL